MITAEEREEEFREDLKKLLLKHGAMLELDTEYDPYSNIQYPILEVTMCAVEGDITRDTKKEYVNFTIDTDEI